jgi:Fe-S cluster assembly iron-binding protein IscA
MIQLTERAAEGLKKILSAEGTPGDQGVKLVPDESPSQGDSVMGEGKRPLLIVDSMIAERLDGVVLDLTGEEPEEQLRFVLRGSEPGAPSPPR